MAMNDDHLALFSSGDPPLDLPLQVLCEDHNGTYVLPFSYEWHEGAWQNSSSTKGNRCLEVKVVGWRDPRRPNGQT